MYLCGTCGAKYDNDLDIGISYIDQKEYCEKCLSFEVEHYIKDEVGGIHGVGLGWNPQGKWCGECCNLTCKGCVNEFKK